MHILFIQTKTIVKYFALMWTCKFEQISENTVQANKKV